jgi:hypothetical protein
LVLFFSHFHHNNGDIDTINGLDLKALGLERNYLKDYYNVLFHT